MYFIYSVVIVLTFSLQSFVSMQGTNILSGKPSSQSGTYSKTYPFPSRYANDGKESDPSFTSYHSNPYWEGDLQGYFIVTKITVTSDIIGWATHLQDAIIGASVSSVSRCPDNKMFSCGRWPAVYLGGETITFDCSLTTPVRYIRITRELIGHLAIAEVEAERVPIKLPGYYYDNFKSEKVTEPVKSLSATSVTGCGTMCYNTQLCLAFSYSKTHAPNCLLATDTSMSTDADWVTYKMNECIKTPTTCPPIN